MKIIAEEVFSKMTELESFNPYGKIDDNEKFCQRAMLLAKELSIEKSQDYLQKVLQVMISNHLPPLAEILTIADILKHDFNAVELQIMLSTYLKKSQVKKAEKIAELRGQELQLEEWEALLQAFLEQNRLDTADFFEIIRIGEKLGRPFSEDEWEAIQIGLWHANALSYATVCKIAELRGEAVTQYELGNCLERSIQFCELEEVLKLTKLLGRPLNPDELMILIGNYIKGIGTRRNEYASLMMFLSFVPEDKYFLYGSQLIHGYIESLFSSQLRNSINYILEHFTAKQTAEVFNKELIHYLKKGEIAKIIYIMQSLLRSVDDDDWLVLGKLNKDEWLILLASLIEERHLPDFHNCLEHLEVTDVERVKLGHFIQEWRDFK